MTDTLEFRLGHALEALGPAPSDGIFRIAVLERRERAESRRRLITACVRALATAIAAALAVVGIVWLVPAGIGHQTMVGAVGLAALFSVARPDGTGWSGSSHPGIVIRLLSAIIPGSRSAGQDF